MENAWDEKTKWTISRHSDSNRGACRPTGSDEQKPGAGNWTRADMQALPRCRKRWLHANACQVPTSYCGLPWFISHPRNPLLYLVVFIESPISKIDRLLWSYNTQIIANYLYFPSCLYLMTIDLWKQILYEPPSIFPSNCTLTMQAYC